jgi:hypothetical protein
MVDRLRKSKRGEGVGGTVGVTSDPNSPSFDPATHDTSTDKKIRELLGDEIIGKLSEWERQFLMDSYGADRLSRKVHITVWKIHKKHIEEDER